MRRTILYRRPLGLLLAALAVSALALTGCDTGGDAEEEALSADTLTEGAERERGAADLEGEAFTAELAPVNGDLLEAQPRGNARMTVEGDSLVIAVSMQGVPASMMHLQHFHGFQDSSAARCPGPAADGNGDGVIDVRETESTAGVTMVPFHGDPASMEIQSESYPQADSAGSYSYRHTVALDALRTAFEEKFGTRDLALGERVIFVHGVPQDAQLPETAASVGEVPAHVTLPIACGEIQAESG